MFNTFAKQVTIALHLSALKIFIVECFTLFLHITKRPPLLGPILPFSFQIAKNHNAAMNDFSVHITNRLELFLTSLLCWRKTWLAGLQLKEDVSSSPTQQVPHTHTHEYTQFHIRKHVQSHIPNSCALTYKQVQYRHTNKLNFIFIIMFIFIVPPFYVCTHTRNLNHVLVFISTSTVDTHTSTNKLHLLRCSKILLLQPACRKDVALL